MTVKHILMLVGDYSEDYEVMVPFQSLKMLGHTVHAVCPNKKPGDTIRTAIHDFEGLQTYTEKPGHNFEINYDFEQVKSESYDALVIPGGRAPEYLRLNKRILNIVWQFDKANKPIAAICHGPQLLISAGIIKDKICSAYPTCGPEITLAGGIYRELAADQAITDDNLVTAPAWPAHPAWLAQFVKLLSNSLSRPAKR